MSGVFNLDQFISLSTEKGSHFFSKGALRFFKSRLLRSTFKRLDNHVFFVTSEKGFSGSSRAYTIRRGSLKTGSVDSLSGFQEYRTRSQAVSALNRILGEKTNG